MPGLSLLGQLAGSLQVALLWTVCNFGLATRLFFEPFSAKLAWDSTSTFAWVLWNWMQRMFEVAHNGEESLTFSGDELVEGESAIVIANHQSFNDYLFVQGLAVRAGMLSRCRYFAKKQLVWQIPVFGIGFWLIGFLLIDRNWAEDKDKIDSTFRKIKKNKSPIWVLTYLEGTRRTPKGIEASQAFCRKTGKPVLSEVLFPRTKGFVATVQGLRDSHVKAVLDVTIAITSPDGFQTPFLPLTLYGVPDLTKAGYRFHVHVKRTLISDLPEDPAEVAAWAENAWVEKDAVLKGMRKDWTEADVLKEGTMGGVKRRTWFAKWPLGKLEGSQKGKKKAE